MWTSTLSGPAPSSSPPATAVHPPVLQGWRGQRGQGIRRTPPRDASRSGGGVGKGVAWLPTRAPAQLRGHLAPAAVGVVGQQVACIAVSLPYAPASWPPSPAPTSKAAQPRSPSPTCPTPRQVPWMLRLLLEGPDPLSGSAASWRPSAKGSGSMGSMPKATHSPVSSGDCVGVTAVALFHG